MHLCVKHAVNHAENPSCEDASLVSIPAARQLGHQTVELGTGLSGLRQKPTQLRPPGVDDAVTPVFRLSKNRLCLSIRARCRIECRADRLGVDVSHQFANQLALSSQCAAGFHPRRHDDGLEQVFAEWDLPQPVFGKSDEFFTQFLKGVPVSLSGAF